MKTRGGSITGSTSRKPGFATSSMGRGILGMNRLLGLVHQEDLLTVGTDQANALTECCCLQVGSVERGMAERANDTSHGGLL